MKRLPEVTNTPDRLSATTTNPESRLPFLREHLWGGERDQAASCTLSIFFFFSSLQGDTGSGRTTQTDQALFIFLSRIVGAQETKIPVGRVISCSRQNTKNTKQPTPLAPVPAALSEPCDSARASHWVEPQSESGRATPDTAAKFEWSNRNVTVSQP